MTKKLVLNAKDNSASVKDDPEHAGRLPTADHVFNEKVIVFSGAVQGRLDDVAVSWGYDNIVSLCSYDGDSNPRYAAEGAVGKKGRSEAWEYCEIELEKIRLGERPEPESAEAFILELPPIVRPLGGN